MPKSAAKLTGKHIILGSHCSRESIDAASGAQNAHPIPSSKGVIMETMKKHPRRIRVLLFLLTLTFAILTGCSNRGRLDEGNCECVITLVDLPKEFIMLEDNIRNNFEVKVILKNITTEKLYHITLTEKERRVFEDKYRILLELWD